MLLTDRPPLIAPTARASLEQALGYISSAQGLFNRMAAASVVSSIPKIVLALSNQRYLIRGLSFGAVKG